MSIIQMGVEVMSDLENQIARIQDAESEARGITHNAKHLCYPITDITVALSRLASECGLEEEMDYYLDDVREAENKLESAFYRCEEVFADRRTALENELQDIEEKESEYDEG